MTNIISLNGAGSSTKEPEKAGTTYVVTLKTDDGKTTEHTAKGFLSTWGPLFAISSTQNGDSGPDFLTLFERIVSVEKVSEVDEEDSEVDTTE